MDVRLSQGRLVHRDLKELLAPAVTLDPLEQGCPVSLARKGPPAPRGHRGPLVNLAA